MTGNHPPFNDSETVGFHSDSPSTRVKLLPVDIPSPRLYSSKIGRKIKPAPMCLQVSGACVIYHLAESGIQGSSLDIAVGKLWRRHAAVVMIMISIEQCRCSMRVSPFAMYAELSRWLMYSSPDEFDQMTMSR
jgi:hypothetical protein